MSAFALLFVSRPSLLIFGSYQRQTTVHRLVWQLCWYHSCQGCTYLFSKLKTWHQLRACGGCNTSTSSNSSNNRQQAEVSFCLPAGVSSSALQLAAGIQPTRAAIMRDSIGEVCTACALYRWLYPAAVHVLFQHALCAATSIMHAAQCNRVPLICDRRVLLLSRKFLKQKRCIAHCIAACM